MIEAITSSGSSKSFAPLGRITSFALIEVPIPIFSVSISIFLGNLSIGHEIVRSLLTVLK